MCSEVSSLGGGYLRCISRHSVHDDGDSGDGTSVVTVVSSITFSAVLAVISVQTRVVLTIFMSSGVSSVGAFVVVEVLTFVSVETGVVLSVVVGTGISTGVQGNGASTTSGGYSGEVSGLGSSDFRCVVHRGGSVATIRIAIVLWASEGYGGCHQEKYDGLQ